MKRLIILNIISIVLYLIYASILIINFNLINTPIINLWFPLFCVTMGLSLLAKAIIFKMDSAAWFSVFMLLNGAVAFYVLYYNLNYGLFWPTIFTAATIASLLVAILFKEILHVFLFFMMLIIQVPMYLFVLSILNVFWFVVLLVLTIIAVVFVAEKLSKKTYFKRRFNGEV